MTSASLSQHPRARRTPLLLACLTAAGLAACSSTDSGPRTDVELEPASAAQQLAGVCEDTVTVQLQWQPQSDMGALFRMLGPDYAVDTGEKSVTGSLVAGGKDTGVDLTLKAGGPAIGFQSVTSQMYVDDDIDLGLVHTDQLVAAAADQPVVGVAPLLTHSPAMLMWNPDTYGPDFDLTKLAGSGATVVVSKEQTYPAWLVAKGFARQDQIDTSYDGNPARFVADPEIVQQGFANSEPYTYEHDTPAWGKPVAYQMLKDVGYDLYASNLSVRTDRLQAMTPCLQKLVPIVQQATADYLADPEPTNTEIVDIVAADGSYSPYTQGEADYSSSLLADEGLIENENGSVATYDMTRAQGMVDLLAPIIRAQGNSVPADVSATTLFDDQFGDRAIGVQ